MLLHARHHLHDRIQQTADILFPVKSARMRLMAAACGIPFRDWDKWMFYRWSPEQSDGINRILADLLRAHAASLPQYEDRQKRDLIYLAEQYEAPRHRPVMPPAPGADTGQQFIRTEPSDDIPAEPIADMTGIPVELHAQWKELLADED